MERMSTQIDIEYTKVLEENGVKLRVSQDHNIPEKSDVFFNPKIKINRELVLCGLSVFLDQHKEYAKHPAQCLDAFASSGALGIQWQKHLKHQKRIILNDIKPTAVQNIYFNCQQNQIKYSTADQMMECRTLGSLIEGNRKSKESCDTRSDGEMEESHLIDDGGKPDMEDNSVEVICQDAGILLLQRAFDFIHLDPFGTSVHYLESAFRNTPNKGIVSITSTDLASVYGRCPKMTMRHYSANVIRNEYYRELAARLILGAVARAAARCNKGIEVLVSVAYEHFILVMVRVVRGPRHADSSIEKVQKVIHCLLCGERCFVPGTRCVERDYYTLLKCKCKQNSPGKTAVFLGPVWSHSIFKAEFVHAMLQSSIHLKLSSTVIELLKTLQSEAVCSRTVNTMIQQPHKIEKTTYTKMDDAILSSTIGDEKESTKCVKRPSDEATSMAKRICKDQETVISAPCFYYNIHLHTAKGKDALKMKKVIELLKQNGYRASRTHFDPVAVRTNADMHSFLEILTSNSQPTSRP
ncbi:TRMT1-like protein [Antedon mediterranea]|uniref:TRMT1-like protein n=1 Tax=Antedon mediterranea TaxID=105859 RepID=UPI003AF57DC6